LWSGGKLLSPEVVIPEKGEGTVRRFWCAFFIIWPILAIYVCAISPARNWWFPNEAPNDIGQRIDGLFYLVLYITTVVFIGTHIALGYVLWEGSRKKEGEKAWFSHGSHNLEVIWTIVPSVILLFIALYQIDVWAEYRMKSKFPDKILLNPIAEVTARQFEWRIRYPGVDRKFKDEADIENWLKNPEPEDLYSVNDLHVTSGKPVLIHLRSADVQHSFFLPELRIKQDAVPGLIIPVWFNATYSDDYALLCAELCGWGHYKMKARVVAQSEEEFRQFKLNLQREQFDDGTDQSSDQPGDEEVNEVQK
jgi:cytochrome c oxidase subunit 2